MGEGLLTEPISPLRQAQDAARSGDLRRSSVVGRWSARLRPPMAL